jgi:glucose-6-phosphate-specific signal transduction histidine kinase
MKEVVLMTHVLFGVACLLGSVWIFVDVLNATAASRARVGKLSIAVALAMWVAYVVAGYWYVDFYGADKAVILKGPWAFAHNFFMETKEHVVIMLLLLATYLPIAAASDFVASKEARRLVLWVAALTALTALAADGMGAVIAMGVKVGLEPK